MDQRGLINGEPARILIFGRYGQVGSALCRQLGARQDVVVVATDVDELDLTDAAATRQKVLDTQPHWVINTSAHTAVDKAESEETLAHALNAEAPGVIATACADCGAAMVHYSTDYVFDGTASTPYLETDRTQSGQRLRPDKAGGRASSRRRATPTSHLSHGLGLLPGRQEFRQHHASPRDRTQVAACGGRPGRKPHPGRGPGNGPPSKRSLQILSGRCRQAARSRTAGGSTMPREQGVTNWSGFSRRAIMALNPATTKCQR